LADIFSRKQPLFGPSDGSFFRISFSAEGKLGQDLRKISTERMPIGPEDEPACHDVVADVLGLLRDTITPPASRGIFDPPHIMTRSIKATTEISAGEEPGTTVELVLYKRGRPETAGAGIKDEINSGRA
jgi:hypothetical protein